MVGTGEVTTRRMGRAKRNPSAMSLMGFASAQPILQMPSMHADLAGFPAQHRLLAGDAPVIAGRADIVTLMCIRHDAIHGECPF